MYLDPGMAGILISTGIAIAAVAGTIVFSIRRKAKQLLKKDEKVSKPVQKGTDNEEIIDTLDE